MERNRYEPRCRFFTKILSRQDGAEKGPKGPLVEVPEAAAHRLWRVLPEDLPGLDEVRVSRGVEADVTDPERL